MSGYPILQTSMQTIVPSYSANSEYSSYYLSNATYLDPSLQNCNLFYSQTEISESIESVIASKKTSSSNSKFFAGTAREILIPLSILKNNSSLEAIVCYLKDIQNLNYSQIASILNRDPRTIWVTYSNSKKKKISLHLDDNLAEYSDSSHSDFLKSVHRNLNAFKILLPAKIFESRKFSVLESIVLYLKTNHALSFNQIAALLGKNYRTIWTVYKRALMKLEQKSLSKSRITNE